jgi:tetratricopeptide (TPR) repeat protein
MASFYFDRFSREPYNEQWTRFLQTGSHINDLQTVIKDQTAGIQQTLTAVSREHRQIIEKSAAVVCQTLERGFSQVVEQLDQANWRLHEINQGIGNLHAMLDWKTDIIIEQLYINNNYLRQITELLRIPDSQKQKALHIEKGLTYLQSGLKSLENKRFFDEALDEFQLSLNIDRKDFFSLHRMGLIHFYSINHLNLDKAYKYFTDAAFHAIVESNIDDTQRNYSLTRYEKGNSSKDVYLEEAANSLIYASRCCYMLNNLQTGIQKAEEAWKLTPRFPEAGFQLAKMLAVANQPVIAANVLEEVININRYYAIKTIEDFDLVKQTAVQNKLEELRKKTVSEASTILTECRRKMIVGSKATLLLQEIAALINANNFIDAKKALDWLKIKRKWEYTDYQINTLRKWEKQIYRNAQ